MTTSEYSLCLLGAAIVFVVGITMLFINRFKKKHTGKSILPLIIIGWILVAIALIGAVIATIISIYSTSGTWGVMILIALGGIFIFAGLVVFLGIGISSLVEGCKKDRNGDRDKEAIVRGATLLFLAIAVLTTVIITFAIMMYIESNKEKPVRMMIDLLWIIKYLIAF
jgi:hypothetical protein